LERQDDQALDATNPGRLFHQGRPRRRSSKGWPWIEAELTRALKEQLTGLKILNTKKGRVKLNEDMVITCELIYGYKVFLYLMNMKKRDK